MSAATYRFYPWVREGYRPTEVDTLGDALSDPAALEVLVTLRGSGDTSETDSRSKQLRLYGPGEIVGIDLRQVVKTTPTVGTTDFVPNRFVTVEFDEPSLPWMFSPAAANAEGAVRPWLCLVTVEKQEGVDIIVDERRPLPTLRITDPADPRSELPDLTESYGWAHAQIVGDPEENPATVFGRESDRTISRLISPRLLDTHTAYYACVVPVFRPGVLAGLGRDLDMHSEEMAVAWRYDQMPAQIDLPVYYHWEFSTSAAGDFEALIDALDPLAPTEVSSVGIRRVDTSDPGFEQLAVPPGDDPIEVDLEGAIRSPMIDPQVYPLAKRETITSLLNQASALEPESGWPSESGRPVLGPPLYGQWPPAAVTIPEEGSGPVWLRDVNADPRYRMAAGFGTQVVQDQQEQLMRSAWEQVGDIRRANELVNRARLSREAEGPIYSAMRTLSTAELLRFTAPTHRRLLRSPPDDEPEATIDATLADSSLRPAVLSPSFRRITRSQGAVSRRFERRGQSLDVGEVTQRFIDGEVEAPTTAEGVGTFEEIQDQLCESADDAQSTLEDERAEWAERFAEDASLLAAKLQEACDSFDQVTRQILQEADVDTETLLSLRKLSGLAPDMCGIVERLSIDIEAEAHVQLSDDVSGFIELLKEAGEIIHTVRERVEREETELSMDRLTELTTHFGAVVERFGALFYVILHPVLRAQCELLEKKLEEAVEPLEPNTATPDAERGLTDKLRALCTLLCGSSDENRSGLVARLEEASQALEIERVAAFVAAASWVISLGRETLTTLTESVEQGAIGGGDTKALADLDQGCLRVEELLSYLNIVLADAPAGPGSGLSDALCEPSGESTPPVDLTGIEEDIVTALDPEETICRHVRHQIGGTFDLDAEDREDCLDLILMSPEFPQPMYHGLRELSQEYLMPGVGQLPNDSISVLETNPAFIEAYMLGLNHEMARELLWREYPTDRRGTYFRQFWDVKGHVPEPTAEAEVEALRDIDPIHRWQDAHEVGESLLAKLESRPGVTGGGSGGENGAPEGTIVLVVRGRLLDRYPNTVIYAAEATIDPADGSRSPDLPDPESGHDGSVEFPIFKGRLEPDVTFFGFDLDPDEAVAGAGYFFVFEEPPGEPGFGLDVAVDDGGGDATDLKEWANVTWADALNGSAPYASLDGSLADQTLKFEIDSDSEATLTWGKNSAHMANITWQRPVRVAIHADDMLPVTSDGDE